MYIFNGKWKEVWFSNIALTDAIRGADNKIIESVYENNQWLFKKLKVNADKPSNITTVEGVVYFIVIL